VIKTDKEAKKIDGKIEKEQKKFLHKAKSLNRSISDQEHNLENLNKQAARVLLRDQKKVDTESRKFDSATKQLQNVEAHTQPQHVEEFKKHIAGMSDRIKALLSELKHDQDNFERNSKHKLADLQGTLHKLAELKKVHQEKMAQFKSELNKLSEVRLTNEAKTPAPVEANAAPSISASHKALNVPAPVPVVPLPAPEVKHQKIYESKFKHWVLKKIRHTHNHIFERNLKNSFANEDERNATIEHNLTKVYDKKRAAILDKYHRQLLHYKKVHDSHVERLKKKEKLVKKKIGTEMHKEKVHAEAITLTKHHYKVYLRTCENQVKTCINYCAKGHLYERSVHMDHTATYKCGGYGHGLETCDSTAFLTKVTQLRTCGDACINEGRCLTFFKNEYSSIHGLCRKIKKQCEAHFCPGKMLKGHLSCILDCGGEMCSDVFEAQHEIAKYLTENAKFLKHMKNVISEDQDRPDPVNPIIASGKQ
jgi:hypothetical protein